MRLLATAPSTSMPALVAKGQESEQSTYNTVSTLMVVSVSNWLTFLVGEKDRIIQDIFLIACLCKRHHVHDPLCMNAWMARL